MTTCLFLKRWKKINIKEVIFILASAIQDILASTFLKWWRKCFPDIDNLLESSYTDNVREETEYQANVNDLQSSPGGNELQVEDVEKKITSDEALENEFITIDEIIGIANEYDYEDDE